MASLLPPDRRPSRLSLRERIAAGETVLAPGCYDALGARLVEEGGFPAAYMTGFGTTAGRLGRPDIGLLALPVMPKKCGHMEGKQLIEAGEMAAKVRAAVAARRSADFLVIARTDARAVEGLEGALARRSTLCPR